MIHRSLTSSLNVQHLVPTLSMCMTVHVAVHDHACCDVALMYMCVSSLANQYRTVSHIDMHMLAGQDATSDGKTPAFIWEEDAWVNSARQIKAANPDTAVVVWMDTMLVYTGWNMSGTAINHTLNPDAVAACATGHFRPAEFIERCVMAVVVSCALMSMYCVCVCVCPSRNNLLMESVSFVRV